MTTLKDLLKDFGDEMFDLGAAAERGEDEYGASIEDQKQELLDEYIETIKDRFIG